MRNRKEIESDISSLTQAQNKIKAELAQLEGAETVHLNQAGEDLIAGNKVQSMQALADVRARKEALNHALSLAQMKLQAAQNELQNVEYDERKKVWGEFEKDMWTRLEAIQAGIGLNGLKGKLDELSDLLLQAQGQNLGTFAQDASYKLDHIQFALTEATRALFEAWKQIENISNLNPTYKPTPHAAPHAGFGKLP